VRVPDTVTAAGEIDERPVCEGDPVVLRDRRGDGVTLFVSPNRDDGVRIEENVADPVLLLNSEREEDPEGEGD
jgi:hypothetical protein